MRLVTSPHQPLLVMILPEGRPGFLAPAPFFGFSGSVVRSRLVDKPAFSGPHKVQAGRNFPQMLGL
jgi:hypothetical protein